MNRMVYRSLVMIVIACSALCCPAEGSGEVWSELQGVMSVLEGSINTRRAWAASHTACGQDGQMEHLTAARDGWVQVTQVRHGHNVR